MFTSQTRRAAGQPHRRYRGGRVAAAAATVATFGLVLSACGGNGTGPGDGTMELQVALWGDSDRAALYEAAVEIFEEEHENVSIDLQFADLTPYLERLATSAAAGDLPDVMFMRDTHLGRYGSSGALLDLGEYIGDTIDTDDLGETAAADGTVGDGVYGLPSHYVGQATLYDAARLAEVDVDPAELDTWDGYAEAARAAMDTADGYYGTVDPTTGSTHRHFESWIRQADEELFTDEGEIGFTAETAESWFQFWADLRDAGAAPPADIQKESESSGWTNDLIVTGRAALRPSSTNHLTIVQDLTPNDIGLAGVPASPDASEDWRFFPPILLSAAANTDHPEMATELISFLINNVDAAVETTLSQGAPSSAAVREALLPELTEDETEFITQISEEQELPQRSFPIRPEGAEAFNAEITRAGEEIAYGRLSVEEAVAQLIRNGERVLAENNG